MAGELDVVLAGRRAKIEFLGDEIIFRVADYRTAMAFLQRPLPPSGIVGKILTHGQMELKARVGNRKPVRLFPDPGWILRLLSPSVRAMVEATKGN